ncbi:hypothetical protein DYI25_15115 [Mesobacillus boroniphilus]|uniref:O-antigen ligase-related domain-containing protein n=1 Tax=Mesobacillus boroniphilus TaxID=308892 RepID=A0A944CMI9_9BACI|nr:hypothetical protein [Mesobacillus boroniphilus]MBS8265755.1 hypothetical protein [Mesobacillus boroniphilus]
MTKFEKILLTVFFVELFIGGGGRLIDFGVLSIRQVLFLLLIVTFMFRIVKNKAFLNKEMNTFIRMNPITLGIYILILWFFVSVIIGYLNGHALSVIVTDFFRVSFFAVYFPLAYYISDERFSKNRIITLLKYSALIVALFTITVSVLGKTVFSSSFDNFYYFMNWLMNDDLYFRPSASVFYKSHLFVLIGLILSLNAVLDKKYTKVDIANIIFCSISILWSETRGFLLAFVLSVFMIILLDAKVLTDPIKGLAKKGAYLLKSRYFLKKFIILVLVASSVPLLYNNMTLDRFESEVVEEQPGDEIAEDGEKGNSGGRKNTETEVNDVSVNTRLEFIIDSKDIILASPANLVVGTGYGTEIAGRVTGLEMSFLDILVEQGLIGLAVWAFLFLIVFYNYYKAYKRGAKLSILEISLLSAFMGLLLLTNINPFINNPIGISFFIILLVLSQNKKDSWSKEIK